MVSPIDTPPKQSCNPLATAVSNTSVISGSSTLLRQMSQPQRPESATASPDLLVLQSSQSSSSQPEPANKISNWSASSPFHAHP